MTGIKITFQAPSDTPCACASAFNQPHHHIFGSILFFPPPKAGALKQIWGGLSPKQGVGASVLPPCRNLSSKSLPCSVLPAWIRTWGGSYLYSRSLFINLVFLNNYSEGPGWAQPNGGFILQPLESALMSLSFGNSDGSDAPTRKVTFFSIKKKITKIQQLPFLAEKKSWKFRSHLFWHKKKKKITKIQIRWKIVVGGGKGTPPVSQHGCSGVPRLAQINVN